MSEEQEKPEPCMRYLAPYSRLSRLMLAVLGVILLGGCARGTDTSVAKQPTNTTCAQFRQPVLAQICATEISDVAFRFQLSGSTEEGDRYVGTGTGMATSNPQRFQFSVVLLNGGTTFAWDQIDDIAADSDYQRYSQPPAMASSSWDKLRLTDDAFMVEQTLDYRKLENATTVGTDQVAGMSVWHVHSYATEGSNQAQEDVYVRKDIFTPVRLVLSITDPVSRTNITYDFTSVNTGLMLSLPSPTQVRG